MIAPERQLNLGMCVRARIIAAGTSGGAYQADVLRSSLAYAVPPVARSACSRWCAEPLERCMAAMAARALAYARAQPVERSGPLGGVAEWSRVASTTGKVRALLVHAFPGTGDDAALKLPQVRSVGCGAPVHDQCSPAREPDRRHLPVDESWRGSGLRADLADASRARLRACEAHGVRVGIRRQDTGTPTVDDSARGPGTPAFLPGTDLEALRADEPLVLDGRALDADGHGGRAKTPRHRRRVGIRTPTGDGCCRTHLLPRIGPWQVADRYRGRGEGDLRLRLDQSGHRLDQRDAERPWSV